MPKTLVNMIYIVIDVPQFLSLMGRIAKEDTSPTLAESLSIVTLLVTLGRKRVISGPC